MQKAFYFLIIIFLLITCTNKKKVDRSLYEEELNKREIKRVPEVELFNTAKEIGEKIANLSQQKLGTNLQQAIKEQGIQEAIKFCNLNAYSLVDSLEKAYGAEIKRVSFQYRNPSDKPDSLESQILDAYQYDFENDSELQSNIQEIHHTDYLLFTKPILINNPLCLQCHGEVGKELTDETVGLIKELYPGDLATGYKMNDLRGMWSIRLSRKEIILSEF